MRDLKQHKFISFDKDNNKYLVQIISKKQKPYKNLFKKRFKNLDEAIIERDLFLSKYEDKRYKGVSYHKNINKWVSNITIKGKAIHLSTHNTQEEAKNYRNEILLKLIN